MSRYPYIVTLVMASFLMGSLGSQAEAVDKTRGAPIYNLKPLQSGRQIISSKQIRREAVDCLKGHLGIIKSGGRGTIADWNRIKTRSIKLQSVIFSPEKVVAKSDKQQPELVPFEARYRAMMNGKPTTLFLRSSMILDPELPQFQSRSKSPHYYGGVRSKSFSKADPLTIGWID